jgi:hypothetical protein
MDSLKPSHLMIAFVVGVVGGIAFAFGSRIEGLAAKKVKLGDTVQTLGESA